MTEKVPSNLPTHSRGLRLNTFEEKVLRKACAGEETSSASFPADISQLIIAAIGALHEKGYIEALVVPSNGSSPLPVFATVLRVLPKGVYYCNGVE